MDGPLPGNTSGTARLLLGAPSYAVGWQERLLLPNPAAGQPLTYTVDGRFYERLIAVTLTLTTSVVVANRFLQFYLQDNNGVTVTSAPGGGVVVASSTLNPFLTYDAPSYSNGASGGTFGKIPDVLAPPGWKWVAQVFNMDAADQISGAVLLVQRYPNDAVEIQANG